MADSAVVCAEERETLEAIYLQDFEALEEREWCLKLASGRALLYLSLPSDYPSSAPVPRLEPASGADFPSSFAGRVANAFTEAFTPGEACAYTCISAVEDELRDLRDLEGSGQPGTGGGGGGEDATNTAESTVPITGAAAEKVGTSLLAAGFQGYPNGLYSHLTMGITTYVTDVLTVTLDGVDAEDLTDWLALQLEDPPAFGASLVDWATAQRSEEPGFAEGGEESAVSGMDFLPSAEALHVNRDRPLTIYTWGKAFRKQMPPESQANFNAAILNGRGGGADLRVDNGLTEAVQRNVASCGLFPRWLEMVITKIETDNLSAVSINCTKGRHRSVAAAEILAREYYPKASTVHTSPAIKR